MGARLIVGAGLLALLGMAIGLAALVYGPGATVTPEELSSAVLQLEDVSNGRSGGNCENEVSNTALPTAEETAAVVFQLGERRSNGEPSVCVVSGARAVRTPALALAAFKEAVGWFPKYKRLSGYPAYSDFSLETIDTPSIGDRSFSYTWSCLHDCKPEIARVYVIQFQRSNVLGLITLSGPDDVVSLDQAVTYAKKQEQRIDGVFGIT